MAAAIPIYDVTPMEPQYVGEDQAENKIWGKKVLYLDETARAAYQLQIVGGLIYDAEGNLFDTSDAHSLHSNYNRAIFVMDEHGTFYASKYHVAGEFHHSSLVAGQPVAAAGEIEVRDGHLVAISDKSGHYRPLIRFTYQGLDELSKKGVDLKLIQLDIISTV